MLISADGLNVEIVSLSSQTLAKRPIESASSVKQFLDLIRMADGEPPEKKHAPGRGPSHAFRSACSFSSAAGVRRREERGVRMAALIFSESCCAAFRSDADSAVTEPSVFHPSLLLSGSNETACVRASFDAADTDRGGGSVGGPTGKGSCSAGFHLLCPDLGSYVAGT